MELKEKFKAKFRLPRGDFLEPINLTDTEIGFSVYKTRKEHGFKSLFRVYVSGKDFKAPTSLKPVTVTASYGKESGDRLVISSSDFDRKLNWPIDLLSEGEFFYDIKSDRLCYGQQEIDGLELLEIVDGWHTKPTRLVGGSWLRIKMFWFHSVLTSVFKILFDIVSGIQYLISGYKIHIFDRLTESRMHIHPFEHRKLKDFRDEPIDIFGYKVEPWIAALYSTSHLCAYLIFYLLDYKPLLLKNIFNNNFLTLIYAIVSLGLFNAILPQPLKQNKAFEGILLFLQSNYHNFAFKKIKI